ncbi:MAG TPA: right-handed parallel beta-helix repeat-containing protein, partial [Labilithrix sp.]|nr:right-handed parallel beta-helix repeat-containing protein [Labilithrix sp.]
GATHFVDAAFTAGQIDAAHFKTLGAALAAAPAGAVIAVQAGSYAEVLAPPRSLKIVGRCAGQVTVSGPVPASSAGVHPAAGTDVVIEGLTLTGHRSAVLVDGGAKLTLRRVVIDDNQGGGVIAGGTGTRVTLERSVVRASADGNVVKGYGLEASAGAELIVMQSAVTENTGLGIHVTGKGSHGHIEQSVVARTSPDGANDFGTGIIARNAATAEIVASSLAGNHETAVVSYGPGTRVTMTDSVIDGTKSSGVGYGRGVLVDGGLITLERVTLSGNNDIGLLAEAKGTATLTDSVVLGTLPAADKTNGLGVSAIQGSTVTLKGSAVIGSHQSGVAAIGPNAKLLLEDSLVADTQTDAQAERGFGVDLESGGTAELKGSALVGNASAGVGALDAGSRVTMTGSVVLATRADGKKKGGRGLAIETGAAAAISTSAFIGNRDIGISVRGAGATATVDQTVVRNTLPLESNGTHGRGIEVGSGGKATVARASFLANHGVAVLAISKGSIDMQNAWIADTDADKASGGPGRAATVQDGAAMTMLGVVAQRSRQAAFVVASGGASLGVRGSRVEDVAAGDGGEFGHGILALEGGTLALDDVTVRRCASVGLVFDASSGT